MPLTQLPALDTALLSLQGKDVPAVLAEMFDRVATLADVTDRDQAWKDLLARHAAGPLALSAEIALPHARTSAVKRLIFAAGRHAAGVAFDPQHPAVKLIFMVLTPKEQPGEYLQLVATLASRLRDAAVRTRLLTASTAEEFETALGG